MQSVIRLTNVWKKYDMVKNDPLVVLREVGIDVHKGEFVAITGPSGSGKSTMMNIVGALDRPSWGSLHINDQDTDEMDDASLAFYRGRTIGFIFQRFNLIPTLNALENVMLPMEIIDKDEKYARARATKLLTDLGLGERLNHKPNELSGGQQQRVAIARALANDPEIILADEPTGNLDSHTGRFIMDFLGAMNKRGKTIILITHDINLVSYADRVIHMKDGKVERETKRGKR